MIAALGSAAEGQSRMFPVGDDNSQRRTVPTVTMALIGINVVVFLAELAGGDQFITNWAFVPSRFSEQPGANAVTIFSAMFMHGGWLHLFGNMLFLWIFGDNVEDRLGHGRFVIFYLICGLVAALLQVMVEAGSRVPMVGASGAIAGVLGAYLVMFPHSRVLTFMFIAFVEIPAVLLLGLWFVTQLLSGLGTLAVVRPEDMGGVAFWAHAGGFAAGAALVPLFRRPERMRVEWWDRVA